MLIYIKNMVCDRCMMIVRQQLTSLGFTVKDLVLGQADIEPEPTDEQLQLIASALKVPGFELISTETEKTVEAIKNVVIGFVHHSDLSAMNTTFSEEISQRLNRDYSYLSRLFSNSQDMTIEHFIIIQKVEKIKELMEYGELNLNEIAYRMGYSSSAHLSTQFKSVTGVTPTSFKTRMRRTRVPIDKV